MQKFPLAWPFVIMEWSAASPPGHMICWLAGEPFRVEPDSDGCGPDGCRITHRSWSLCGFGRTFPEALADLRACAVAMAPAYVDRPDEDLTEAACHLRDFLLRALPGATPASEGIRP